MKKIGLGIAILLFALVVHCCSAGMEWITLIIGIVGLAVAISGFLENKN